MTLEVIGFAAMKQTMYLFLLLLLQTINSLLMVCSNNIPLSCTVYEILTLLPCMWLPMT